MSKQKPNSKGMSGKGTLDENLIQEEVISIDPEKRSVSLKEYNKTAPFSFDARNYKYLLLGLAVSILGFILMIGGGAENPNEFDADALFSPARITVAPMLIVAGYVIVFYAIMKKNKSLEESK